MSALVIIPPSLSTLVRIGMNPLSSLIAAATYMYKWHIIVLYPMIIHANHSLLVSKSALEFTTEKGVHSHPQRIDFNSHSIYSSTLWPELKSSGPTLTIDTCDDTCQINSPRTRWLNQRVVVVVATLISATEYGGRRSGKRMPGKASKNEDAFKTVRFNQLLTELCHWESTIMCSTNIT